MEWEKWLYLKPIFQCSSFSVVSIPGKGLGVVANRTIKQGEIIITEEPVLTVDMRMTDEERQVTIMKQFEKLKTSVKRKVEELCDNQPDGDENQKIVRIFKGNSIQSWHLVEDINLNDESIFL